MFTVLALNTRIFTTVEISYIVELDLRFVNPNLGACNG